MIEKCCLTSCEVRASWVTDPAIYAERRPVCHVHHHAYLANMSRHPDLYAQLKAYIPISEETPNV